MVPSATEQPAAFYRSFARTAHDHRVPLYPWPDRQIAGVGQGPQPAKNDLRCLDEVANGRDPAVPKQPDLFVARIRTSLRGRR